MLLDRIRDEWYPAWDAGDAARFTAVTFDVFAPDARVAPKPGASLASPEELLPAWRQELATWRPQSHEVVFAVEEDDQTAWIMHWTATHAGPLTLPDGRVVAATGHTVDIEAGFFASWEGRRIAELRAFSDYHGLVAELEQLSGC